LFFPWYLTFGDIAAQYLPTRVFKGVDFEFFSAKLEHTKMSSQDFRTTQSVPAYQEMVSEYPLRDTSTPAEDNIDAEAAPASFHSAHAASPSPPPSQATPQSSPKKSQVIVEPSTGALSILANEISFEQEAEAEEDVFEEPESAEEPIRARSLGKDRTQPTIEVEDEPDSPEAPASRSTLPPSAAKRTSKRVSVTKTVVRTHIFHEIFFAPKKFFH
jgi:hypothetical protein